MNNYNRESSFDTPLKRLVDRFFIGRQGVLFLLAIIVYVISLFGIMSLMGSTTSMWSSYESDTWLPVWNTIIALTAFFQLVMGVISIVVRRRNRERLLVFSFFNTFIGLIIFGFYCAGLIAMSIYNGGL